ncbi:MAG: DUF503 domain-containing protein [Candidatus Poribacteria bacterium]|nr:DUF503 domain-containing protein [Candidatus Poribacteria bacterium]
MFVAVCKIHFQTPGCRSLKEKRRIVRSIKDRTRHRFNAAVAEVGLMDRWNECELGVACVSNSARHAESMASKVAEFIEISFPIIVLKVERERW